MKALKDISILDRGHMVWAGLASLLINVLALAMPLVLLQVYDRIVPHKSVSTLTLLAFGTIVAVGCEVALRIVRSHMTAWIAARFEHQTMTSAVSRLLAMPVHQFEHTGPGAYTDKFRAIAGLKDHYAGQTFQLMMDMPFCLIYLAVIAAVGGWMVAVPLAGFAVFALTTFRLSLGQKALVKERNLVDQRRTNFLVESLNGIHSVKAMAMEALMQRRYERLQESCAQLMRRLTLANDLSNGLVALLSPLMTVIVASLGAWMVIHGEMSNGELAACIMLVMRSLGPLQRLGPILARRQQVAVMHEELEELFQQPEMGHDERPPMETGHGPATVELRDVSYRFPGSDSDIIDRISLRVDAGECILIKGGNGSGRSTLLHLMNGLIAPASGSVLVDGTDIAAIEPLSVRQAVAYLPQRAQLFEGTLIDNLSAFDPSRIDEALRIGEALQIEDYVARLRRGYESVVGDAATDTTPIGHRQRIAMVRALSSRPRVLLFDETNTSVDSIGESAMRRFLEEIKGKATIILVTQRPSFQTLADRTFCLVDGRLYPDRGETDFQGRPKLVSINGKPLGRTAADSVGPDRPEQVQSLSIDPETRLRQVVQRPFRQITDFSLCLPPLLQALGWRGDTRDVAEALPYFVDTLDLTGLLNAMVEIGFAPTEVECRLDEIDPRSLPCLFVPQTGPAMVIKSRKDRQLVIHYGGQGKDCAEPMTVPLRALPGTAIFFQKEIRDQRADTSRWVRRTLGRFSPLVLQAALGAIVYGLIMLPMPLFVMAVYDRVIPTGSLSSLGFLAAGALAAVILGGLFVVNRSRILAHICGRIEYLFGTTVLQQILSLSPSVSERAPVGAQVARIGSFEAIRDLFTGPIAATVLESPSTIVFLAALGIINPWALAVVLGAVLIYVLMFIVTVPFANAHVAEVSRTSTKRNEFLVEMVTKMRAVREFGGEYRWLARFRDISADAAMAGYHASRLSATVVGLSHLVMMLTALATLTLSVGMTMGGNLGVGAVVASMMLIWRVLGPLQTVFTSMTRVERIHAAITQLDNLMSMKGERIPTMSPLSARRLSGRVEFSRVSFRYSMNADPAVLGASFEVEPGQVVAITGPNGAGKSTVLKLVAGLYQPQAGSVRIDDVDIRQLDPIELRRLIGYAPQECNLFHGSIAQNLRLVAPAATDDELHHALWRAGAHDDIRDLPKGLESRIGDGNTEKLPASFKQKLSLARLYLTRAPILLFDEPVNGLDFEGDERFMDAIRDLKGKSTIFFVTHRPSHLRLADQVMVYEGGYLRMAGTADDVLKRLSSVA